MAKRYELSDACWEMIEDIITQDQKTGRPRSNDRLMLNGILWVLCSGAAWRDMPERFGPWSTVYQRFRDWRNRGTFDQMLNESLRLIYGSLPNWFIKVDDVFVTMTQFGRT